MNDKDKMIDDARLVSMELNEGMRGFTPEQRELFLCMVIGSLMGMVDRENPNSAAIAMREIAKMARTGVLVSPPPEAKQRTKRRII